MFNANTFLYVGRWNIGDINIIDNFGSGENLLGKWKHLLGKWISNLLAQGNWIEKKNNTLALISVLLQNSLLW